MRTFFALILVISGLVACQSQKDSLLITDDLIQEIANDPLYAAFQETIMQDAENIVLERYDLEAVAKILDENPEEAELCNSGLLKDKILQTKGGDLYVKVECERQQVMQKLDEKFHFVDLPEETHRQIYRLYRQINQEVLDIRSMDLYYEKITKRKN